MEKCDKVGFELTNCSFRTFPNQKVSTIRWNIEDCLNIYPRKPLEAKFSYSGDTATCSLEKSDTSLTFKVILKFPFYCKVAFCNKAGDVLGKKSGDSSNADDSSCEHSFWLSVDFKTLQVLPQDELLIVCTVAKNEKRTVRYSSTHWSYLLDLILIKNTQSDAFRQEKVYLRIGDDAESINKAVLCENSPVIANIFENDENHPNAIDIQGVEFPVLKKMVAFLNSGVLRCEDFESVCSMYCAANKCGIKKLQDACSRLLETKLNAQNICRVLVVSESVKDFQLKNQALRFFKDHAESVLVTDQWCNLMKDELELGLQAIAFRIQEIQKAESNI